MSSPARSFLPRVMLASAAFLAIAGIWLLATRDMKLVGGVLLLVAAGDLVGAIVMSRRV